MEKQNLYDIIFFIVQPHPQMAQYDTRYTVAMFACAEHTMQSLEYYCIILCNCHNSMLPTVNYFKNNIDRLLSDI